MELLLAAGWTFQVLFRLFLAWRETLPRLTPDETGYLLAARVLTGGTGADLSGFSFYQVGYSLLITPAYWLAHDPHTVYRIVVVINALVSSCLLLLAYVALRRLSVGRGAAYVLANASALLPAVVYWNQFAMSDTVMPVVVLSWLLVVHTWLTRGGVGYGIAASALAGYAYAAHARGVVVLLVHVALLLFMLLRRSLSRVQLGIAAQGLTTVTAIAWGLNHFILSRLYPSGPYSMSHFVLSRLTSLSGLAWTFSLGAGQVWYLIVCTWGVAGLGIVVLGYVAFRSSSAVNRTLAVMVLAVMVGVALASSAALPDEHAVNNFVYGRYLSCLAPVLFVVGAATIVRARGRRLVPAFLGVATVVGVMGGIASWYAGKRLSAYPFARFNFPEIAFLIKDWNSLHMWQSTGAALLLLALVMAMRHKLGRDRELLMGMALVAVNVAAMVVSTTQISWPMWRDGNAASDLFPAGLRATDRLAVDYRGLDFRVWMMHAFEVSWHPISVFQRNDPRTLPAATTLVVVPRQVGSAANLSWPKAPAGWRPVLERVDWVAWRHG